MTAADGEVVLTASNTVSGGASTSPRGAPVHPARRLVGTVVRHPYLFVAIMVVLAQVPYAAMGPNLLADDWVWLRNARFDGWFHAGGFRQAGRPGAYLLYALTFGLVGPHPLALYAVQSVLYAAAALALLGLLRQLLPARVALAAATTWVVVPTHTSLAYWSSTAQALVALAALCAGATLVVRSSRSPGRPRLPLAGFVLVAGSVAFYEVTAAAAVAVVTLPWLLGARGRRALAHAVGGVGLVAVPVAWSLGLDTVYPTALARRQVDPGVAIVGNFNLGLPPFSTAGQLVAGLGFGGGLALLAVAVRRRRFETPERLVAGGLVVLVLGVLPLFRVWSNFYGLADRMTTVSGVGAALAWTGLVLAGERQAPRCRGLLTPWAVTALALALVPVHLARAERYRDAGRRSLDALPAIEALLVDDPDLEIEGPIGNADYVDGLNDGWNTTAAVQLRSGDPTVVVRVIINCNLVGPPATEPLSVFGEVSFGRRLPDCTPVPGQG
ncbi:MAG: hypothetical protein ACT4PW_08895 [Acidimicrobiia bacterium]